MRTRENPYTVEEFVQLILNKIGQQDFLDYGLTKNKERLLDTYHFDFVSSLARGGSEGVYLDIGVEFESGERFCIITYKTLDTDKEAYQKMGKLLADFVFEATEFVNEYIDDFDFRQ